MSKFRFRKRKTREHKPDEVPLRAMIPNLVTLMAAASGITSIRYSCQGKWELAVIFIAIACFLDGLDGRVARMLKATSRLGAELDSLADFVSFGVAPAVFTYFWIMEVVPTTSPLYPIRGVFWAFTLFYALCCAFRLARFNIMLDEGPKEPYWKHFFLGLPAPGGAGLLLTPALWQLHTESNLFQSPFIGSAMLILCGILMASRFPTLSAKNLRIPARFQIPLVVFIIFIIGLLVSHAWLTLGCIGLFYLTSVPVCGIVFMRMKRHHESRIIHPAPSPAPRMDAPSR